MTTESTNADHDVSNFEVSLEVFCLLVGGGRCFAGSVSRTMLPDLVLLPDLVGANATSHTIARRHTFSKYEHMRDTVQNRPIVQQEDPHQHM